ncbi:MAG: DNA polymerase III subunit gamma/tau [Gammaproteobacteria bacterium]
MSYLALARKWRPKTFADVVGQNHVVQALVNALQSDRVHHAYLFAGTRGVGKTTLARVLAKALNCDSGVVAEPCGSCDACLAIDEGRFVDLIEVDAASRTRVDDTRELLENVQYTPTAGRYKVYLIDEVHMLSNHSFNALLKTLEEPPPHVKFLLATTDPQKLPVTVLSRCLQFNLKRLAASLIVDRMAFICAEEGFEAEASALARLARAASGSMRDALSLLDQGLAFGGNTLTDASVAEMLGSMDQTHIQALLQALAAGDAGALVEKIRELDEMVPDYQVVLDDMATALQQIAVIQMLGAAGQDDILAGAQELATLMSEELVQLCYQIAITGRRDIELAPDTRLGFEMTMLRMLAFRPAALAPAGAAATEPAITPTKAAGKSAAKAARAPAKKPSKAAAKAGSAEGIEDWPAVVAGLPIDGAAKQLAENCGLIASTPFEVRLKVSRSNEHLLAEKLCDRVNAALAEQYGAGLKVHYEVYDDSGDTVAGRQAQQREQTLESARSSIKGDPTIQELVDVFGAELDADSIRPVQGSD